MRHVVELELGVKFHEPRGHTRLLTISLVPRDGDAGDSGLTPTNSGEKRVNDTDALERHGWLFSLAQGDRRLVLRSY